jgi:hypothetical protein
MISYYYPPDIALELQARWPAHCAPLPALPQLTQLVMVAYQASLLHEEGRPVHCHLLYATPAEVAAYPAAQHHFLAFAQPRLYHEQELRRLSPSVQRGNSALAVHQAADGSLQLWGVVMLGANGDALASGPLSAHTLPNVLLLQVHGPGRLTFYGGTERVLALHQGRIEGYGFWQFPAAWAAGHFRENEPGPAAPSSEQASKVGMELALQMLRRSIGRVRGDGHGGMLVLVPTAGAADLLRPQGLLRPKYEVLPDTNYFIQFVDAITARLAQLNALSWQGYRSVSDPQLRALSHQMDWFTELMADLMAVDGALVISQSFNVLGFGVEIHATFVEPACVYRALDMEATRLQAVPIDGGGTRHRAAYRLCAADPRCLVIVVSQDGNIRFVRQREGQVVFWDQLAL